MRKGKTHFSHVIHVTKFSLFGILYLFLFGIFIANLFLTNYTTLNSYRLTQINNEYRELFKETEVLDSEIVKFQTQNFLDVYSKKTILIDTERTFR